MTCFEGESEPCDRGGRKTVTRGSVDHGRSLLDGFGPLSDALVRRPAVGEDHGQGAETDGQHGESHPEYRPIEGEPRRPVDLACRTEWRQWRERHGENDGQSRTEDNRAKQAEGGVPRHGQRVGPESAQDVEVVVLCPQRSTDGLTGDQEGGQGGDGTEHAEGDRLGLARPLDLTLGHRGHVKGVRRAFGDEVE